VGHEERLPHYAAIESYRKRPLIVYGTSTRPGINASMASDVVRELIEQLDLIPAEQKAIDVLIHSSGGDGLAAWKLMSVLRERFEKVAVLVPFMAFSAATMFALGADEIVMHPHASLGPIDPQIAAKGPDGQMREFAYEDVGAFLRFIETDVKLTEQQHYSSIVDKLFACVDPLTVGAARRASELGISIGERLLATHMDDRERVAKIARDLSKSFFAHGDAVSRTRARELGLQIAKDDRELERLIWKAFEGIETSMELRDAFSPQLVFMADAAGAESLVPPAPANLPPDTPPQLQEAVWNNIGQAAINAANQGRSPRVQYSLLLAVVESVRHVAEARVDGYLTAVRLLDGIKFFRTDTKAGWLRYPIAANQAG